MIERIQLPYYGNGGDGYIYGRIFKSAMNKGEGIRCGRNRILFFKD